MKSNYHKNVFLFSLVLALLISGCANIGRDFDFKGPQDITIGKTTQSEILDRLGGPFRTGWDSGNIQWTYGKYHYDVFGNADTKDLVVIFDSQGVVKSYTYNASLQEGKVKVLAVEQDKKEKQAQGL